MGTLIEARKEYLTKKGISFEYYPPEQTNDGKCRWVYLGSNPSKSFKTYPSFLNYLEKRVCEKFRETSIRNCCKPSYKQCNGKSCYGGTPCPDYEGGN